MQINVIKSQKQSGDEMDEADYHEEYLIEEINMLKKKNDAYIKRIGDAS